MRPDFHDFKYDWMVWVVWQKAQQVEIFRDLLLSTGDAQIYEVGKVTLFGRFGLMRTV